MQLFRSKTVHPQVVVPRVHGSFGCVGDKILVQSPEVVEVLGNDFRWSPGEHFCAFLLLGPYDFLVRHSSHAMAQLRRNECGSIWKKLMMLGAVLRDQGSLNFGDVGGVILGTPLALTLSNGFLQGGAQR